MDRVRIREPRWPWHRLTSVRSIARPGRHARRNCELSQSQSLRSSKGPGPLPFLLTVFTRKWSRWGSRGENRTISHLLVPVAPARGRDLRCSASSHARTRERPGSRPRAGARGRARGRAPPRAPGRRIKRVACAKVSEGIAAISSDTLVCTPYKSVLHLLFVGAIRAMGSLR